MPAELTERGTTASMRRDGNCRDGAPTGSFFNGRKYKRVHGPACATRADAQAGLFEYTGVLRGRHRQHTMLC